VKNIQPAANQGRAAAGRGEVYALVFEQPVDHQKPDGAKFLQRVFVTHTGYDKPVVLIPKAMRPSVLAIPGN